MDTAVTRQFALTNPSGEDIYLFTLHNARGTIVTITNYGAIIVAYAVKRSDGGVNDIVLGFDNIEDYWSPAYLSHHPWFGCVVGRYANRIKDARFELDGERIQLSVNRGKEQLHGGLRGFDRKTWEFVSSGAEPHPFLELRYRSRSGEEGFPGNLDTIVHYELNEENELSYTFRATTDQPSPVNLTQHSYFNLNNGKSSIRDHELKIPASRILQQDENLVATGNYLEVEGTAYDLREFTLLSERLKQIPEFDSSFVIDAPAEGSPVPVAELRCSASGFLLQVLSTEPVVHFYSGKWIPELMGKKGMPYGAFSGLCLETHKHPNAVNLPHFPNTILRPGELYLQRTIYRPLEY